MKNILIISIIIVVAISGFILIINNKNATDFQTVNNIESEYKEDTLEPEIDNTNSDNSVDNVITTRYVDYSENTFSGNAKNIIFFKADWCPSCRGLDKNINENLNNIPNDFIIFKADFDKETKLKAKYGVTLQHTIVVVDENGNLIRKLAGLYSLNTLNDLISAVNSNGN